MLGGTAVLIRGEGGECLVMKGWYLCVRGNDLSVLRPEGGRARAYKVRTGVVAQLSDRRGSACGAHSSRSFPGTEKRPRSMEMMTCSTSQLLSCCRWSRW